MYFEQKLENYQIFISKNFQILVVKSSVYLNRHVFLIWILTSIAINLLGKRELVALLF